MFLFLLRLLVTSTAIDLSIAYSLAG